MPASALTKPLDGLSLKPLFAREIGERRAPIGFRYLARRALVDDRYKLLTDNLAGGKFELYDLQRDPAEVMNLADDPAHQAVKAKLIGMLKTLQVATKDPWIHKWKYE